MLPILNKQILGIEHIHLITPLRICLRYYGVLFEINKMSSSNSNSLSVETPIIEITHFLTFNPTYRISPNISCKNIICKRTKLDQI